MLTSVRQAGLLWPTLMAAAGLAILIGLGNWQMDRKAWKEDLLARLSAQSAAEPTGLGEALRMARNGDLGEVRFQRVIVTGRFAHEHELHVWQPGPRGPAWAVVTPLILGEPVTAGDVAEPIRVVLVIRGVVLEAGKSAETRPDGQPKGLVTVTGRIRLGGSGAFSNPPDVASNQWYEKDLPSMRDELASRRLPGSDGEVGVRIDASSFAPVFLEAEEAMGRQNAPQPDLDAISLRNRHLEYALTWYGLAGTLVAVYLAFAITRLRRRPD